MIKLNHARHYSNFILLIAFVFSASRLAAQTNSPAFTWRAELAAFAASDRTNPPPHGAILFVGSSSFRKWRTMAQDFPGKQIINRGFGGSQIADSTALADQLIFPYDPRMIVFYAGDNDLAAGKTPDQVVADYRAFVDKVHQHLPKTVIAYLSIKPCPLRWKLRGEIKDVNQRIKSMPDQELRFIDIYPLMLRPDGKPRPELFLADGLHPSAQCYQMWAKVITPYLE